MGPSAEARGFKVIPICTWLRSLAVFMSTHAGSAGAHYFGLGLGIVSCQQCHGEKTNKHVRASIELMSLR